MKTNKLTAILVLCAVLSLAFTACEGPMGPVGPAGPAGPTGSTGPAGPGALEVWDSSSPPQRLGFFLNGVDSNYSILTSSGYIVHLNQHTGELTNTNIRFSGPSQTGDPGLWLNNNSPSTNYPTQRLFYNPHSGGTWYTPTSGYPNDYYTTYLSTYNTAGEPEEGESSSGYNHRLEVVAHADTGVPALSSITGPLIIKAGE